MNLIKLIKYEHFNRNCKVEAKKVINKTRLKFLKQFEALDKNNPPDHEGQPEG